MLRYPSSDWYRYLTQWAIAYNAPVGFRFSDALRRVLKGQQPCPRALLDIVLQNLPLVRQRSRDLNRRWSEADAAVPSSTFAYRES